MNVRYRNGQNWQYGGPHSEGKKPAQEHTGLALPGNGAQHSFRFGKPLGAKPGTGERN